MNPEEEQNPGETPEDESPEESPEDKTPEEFKNDTGSEDKSKPRRSEIAQKIKWRERALRAEKDASRVQTLENELAELRGLVKKPEDDKERQAQDYIRKQARQAYEELMAEKKREEDSATEAFETEVEGILDENPDIADEELLDVIEEYEVEPKTALKILKKAQDSPSVKKPKVPVPKRAPSESAETPSADDSKKSFFDIVREETARLRGK